MLGLRILSGVVGVPILVGMVLLGGLWYVGGGLLLIAVATLELLAMLQAGGYHPVLPLGVALSVGIVMDAVFPGQRVLLIVLALGTIATLAWLMLRPDWSGALVDWALTIAPALYVGGLLQFFIPLREMAQAADVQRWSDRQGSPAKSVEGATAGLLAAIVVGALAGLVGAHPSVRVAGLGLAVGLCTVLGDLLESFIKRQCGAKDSGVLVPGHGGILDRMDSMLLAGPGAYLYVVATS